MLIDILTLFPTFYESPISLGIINNAISDTAVIISLLLATCPSFRASSSFLLVGSSVFSPPGPSFAKNCRLYSSITSSPPQRTRSFSSSPQTQNQQRPEAFGSSETSLPDLPVF